jgi:hypothetical protein
MKSIFVMILLISVVVIQLVPAEARSTSEPCSYLNPTKLVRDANGNCVPAQTTQNIVTESKTGYSQARSTSEPCSYLNPTKFYRDANGNCIMIQTPQKTISTSTTQNTISANTVSQSSIIPSTKSIFSQETNNQEPCPVFNTSEYTRDANGNCVLIQKTNPTQNVSPVNFDPKLPTDFGVKFPSNSDSPESLIAIMSILGIIGIGAAKLYQKKLSKISRQQRQWQPVENQVERKFSKYVRRRD